MNIALHEASILIELRYQYFFVNSFQSTAMIPLSHDSFALRTDTHLVVFHQPRRRFSEGAQATDLKPDRCTKVAPRPSTARQIRRRARFSGYRRMERHQHSAAEIETPLHSAVDQ